jgi:hypothetical protein
VHLSKGFINNLSSRLNAGSNNLLWCEFVRKNNNWQAYKNLFNSKRGSLLKKFTLKQYFPSWLNFIVSIAPLRPLYCTSIASLVGSATLYIPIMALSWEWCYYTIVKQGCRITNLQNYWSGLVNMATNFEIFFHREFIFI